MIHGTAQMMCGCVVCNALILSTSSVSKGQLVPVQEMEARRSDHFHSLLAELPRRLSRKANHLHKTRLDSLLPTSMMIPTYSGRESKWLWASLPNASLPWSSLPTLCVCQSGTSLLPDNLGSFCTFCTQSGSAR